jgi:hypothetical protein
MGASADIPLLLKISNTSKPAGAPAIREIAAETLESAVAGANEALRVWLVNRNAGLD